MKQFDFEKIRALQRDWHIVLDRLLADDHRALAHLGFFTIELVLMLDVGLAKKKINYAMLGVDSKTYLDMTAPIRRNYLSIVFEELSQGQGEGNEALQLTHHIAHLPEGFAALPVSRADFNDVCCKAFTRGMKDRLKAFNRTKPSAAEKNNYLREWQAKCARAGELWEFDLAKYGFAPDLFKDLELLPQIARTRQMQRDEAA